MPQRVRRNVLSLLAALERVEDRSEQLDPALAAAPSSPTFNDVPANHPFYRPIEALAASEVTGGCGGGSFCPDALLTRAQMAAFLARALGLDWGVASGP